MVYSSNGVICVSHMVASLRDVLLRCHLEFIEILYHAIVFRSHFNTATQCHIECIPRAAWVELAPKLAPCCCCYSCCSWRAVGSRTNVTAYPSNACLMSTRSGVFNVVRARQVLATHLQSQLHATLVYTTPHNIMSHHTMRCGAIA